MRWWCKGSFRSLRESRVSDMPLIDQKSLSMLTASQNSFIFLGDVYRDTLREKQPVWNPQYYRPLGAILFPPKSGGLPTQDQKHRSRPSFSP